MQLERIALSIIIPHGITDAFVFPLFHTLKIYSLCIPVLCLKKPHRIVALVTASIVHVSKDFGMAASILLHMLLCNSKSLGLTYFSLVHTVLHYKRTVPTRHAGITLPLLGIASCVSYLYMDVGNSVLSTKLGDFWWVSLIVGHVTVNLIKGEQT